MYFSCKTTMDKFACSMVFRTIFFIIVYSDISRQPLYENQRLDPITPNRTELYYQKVYGKQEKNQYFTFLSCHLLCRAQSLFWYWWAYVSAWCRPVPCIYFSNSQSYMNANVCMCMSLRTLIIWNACMHFLYVFGQFPCI